MKKILVPTDFSNPAQWALEVAILISKKTAAKIVLLHTVDEVASESFNVEGQVSTDDEWEDRVFSMKLIEKSKAQLKETAQLIEAEGVEIKTELRIGDPFHEMEEIIKNNEVDLVVMGTSGHSKIEGQSVGSNTQKVVRYAKCPVLTVHQKPLNRRFDNIVYASSLSEGEHAFAEVLKSIQDIYDSTIHLVRINTPMNFQSDHLVKRDMQAFAHKLRLRKCTLNIFSDMSEEEGIVHFSTSINADLITMATHGRTGLSHLLTGSIAEDVVNISAKPVLTYVTK
jgi:nucleotide-binding universal stress UspA family protein